MNELVERVARAIHGVDRSIMAAGGAGGTLTEWETESESARRLYRLHAKAAIAAMREPTEAMVRAGLRSDAANCLSSHGPSARAGRLDVWRAMIDVALKD
jgi:hypothetical protein